MSDSTPQTQPPGWYYAQGDPPGTQRYWDGAQWQGGPQPVPGSVAATAGAGNLAEPVNRILARLIDGVVWFFISLFVGLIFGAAAFGAAAGGADDISYVSGLLAGLVGTAIVAAYEIFFVGTRGATPGKMALGLKVVRMDGSPADMRDAVMRMAHYIGLGVIGALVPLLGIITSLILFVIVVVSLVFLFTDSNRQAVWDKIAKTKVITTK